MGDPAGVGPELLLRAAATFDGAAVLLLGDRTIFERYAAEAGIPAPAVVESPDAARAAAEEGARGPWLLPCAQVEDGLVPGRARVRDGAAALAAVVAGADLAADGAIDALVTAPLSKYTVAAHEPGFRGHTEYLAARDACDHPIMVFAAPREGEAPAADIALLSTHLPLATALSLVRSATVESALRRVHAAWSRRFGRDPVVGVAALNPHAGEHGTIGGEEARVLSPAIQAVRADGIDARGPYPADSIFLRDGLDVILALYHDQGTIMAKRAPWPTVNLTLGLSYVRTSPDHGTAYGLAGTGQADPAATVAALRLAAGLAVS
jgi:4-hydroxythreonine-4-phosphate dehydrogenase